MKLWVKEPSAKILRKRFGNLKAIKKMSLHIPAPKTEVIMMSRKRPVIREINIPKELEKIDLNMCDDVPPLKILRNFNRYVIKMGYFCKRRDLDELIFA